MSYSVVEFSEKPEVGIVRDDWIIRSEHANFSRWPIDENVSVRDKIKPGKDWETHRIKVIHKEKCNYSTAWKLMEEVVITSNIDSDPEDLGVGKRKRKLNPKYVESNANESAKNQKKKKIGSNAKGRQPPTPPNTLLYSLTSLPNEMPNLDEEPVESTSMNAAAEAVTTGTECASRHKTRQPANMRTANKPATTQSQTISVAVQPSTTSAAAQPTCVVTDISQNKSEMELLEQLLKNQERMLELIEEHALQGEEESNSQTVDAVFSSMLLNPADTFEELDEFDEKLSNKVHMKYSLKVLHALGGAHIRDTALRMLNKVGTNRLWSCYSLQGKSGKRALARKTNLIVLFTAACMKRYDKMKQKDILKAFEDKLKAAPYRKGGPRYKGKTSEQDSNTSTPSENSIE